MLLYLIRHGDPDYENDCLTPKGKLQASALAKRLAHHGIDKVYTSPLGRAVQTAEPTCDLLGLQYHIEEWTSETLAWERFSGEVHSDIRTWALAQQNTIFRNDKNLNLNQDWHKADELQMIDGKAGYEKLIGESDKFISSLGYRRKGGVYKIVNPNDDRIAIFCHAGFGSMWTSHLLQIPPHLFWAGFGFTHSSITIFEFQNNADGFTAPQCLCFSDTSHIYKEGLPLQHNNKINI